jgi:TonB-dependent receptor
MVLDAALELMVIQGEELIITAQAEGQMQAINQQITSTSIKNIVSSAKIQELPESNAAEAVGRLPGVSLQREGGEGNKVIIRGLSPQFNKIQINGVNMASTGRVTYIGQDANTVEDDRSVDLSMISPNVLEGIEVSKTAMADQEADQLGGTVNFKLRGAPKKPTLNATIQGGYNGLRSETNNYYYVLGGGMRFFENKFGVFFQAIWKRQIEAATLQMRDMQFNSIL